MILINNLKIALFGFVLCVILVGCTHTTNAPKSYAKTDTPTETQKALESNNIQVKETPDESIATISVAPEPTSSPMPNASTPKPIPTQIPKPEPTPAPLPKPTTTTEPTPEQVTYLYSVWAESGAVITSQDSSTGEFHYKLKCEACGYVKSGETLSFVSGGNGLTSSFTCSKCGNHQKVVIGWSCTRN